MRRFIPNNKALEPSAVAGPRIRIIVICIAIALLAIGVRLLLWQDNRTNFARVFSGMVEHHQNNAHVLLRGEISRFINGPAPPGDANILTYPPGYPIVMAIVFRIFDDSDSSMRSFQIMCDAAAAVLLFFVAGQFLPRAAAIIAAVLAALSPQLAYYSLLLLPDSLATLPILLALYFLIRAVKSPSLLTMVLAGVCVGLSCWLRSNALLLAPFLALVVFFVIKQSAQPTRSKKIISSVALVAATLVVIAPITIRNVVVFHRIIPLSLGAGQMLNVGIGDYDKQRQFGLPRTDLETVTSEAAKYNRPDYANSLFGGDGVERDQRRLANGFAVIRQHPLWFASVLFKRSVSMFKLERVRPVFPEPVPAYWSDGRSQLLASWSKDAAELIGPSSNSIEVSPVAGADAVRVVASSDREAGKILSAPVTLERYSDYLLSVPIKLEEGNLVLTVQSDRRVLARSAVLHPQETSTLLSRPTVNWVFQLSSVDATNATLDLSNDRNRTVRTIAEIGRLDLTRLGPSSLVWTRYLRMVINFAQKFFITAWILPFACLGILLMWLAGKGRYLLVVLAIPAYYICAQSFLHTEYRYVMAIQYSLFICAAAGLYWMGANVCHLMKIVFRRKRSV